jgi:nicotinamide phosphoribosyltransferase
MNKMSQLNNNHNMSSTDKLGTKLGTKSYRPQHPTLVDFASSEATQSVKDTEVRKIQALQNKMAGIVGTNLLLLADSYKTSHRKQYPFKMDGPGGYVYSYFESRGAGAGGHEDVVFFGLQYFMKRYLQGVVVTKEKIDEAALYYESHFGDPTVFDREAWEYIANPDGPHKGKLPVKIMAVPEGTVLPVKNVLFTMVNTDPKCYWLTNFLETLLVQVWYPMTVASNSRAQKLVILSALQKSGTPSQQEIAFKLHDFGCRGVSSMETAGLGALAHLTQFDGTDTVPGLVFGKEYYDATSGAVSPSWGMSIPASEHSTMTSWGDKPFDEYKAYHNMITKYHTGAVACGRCL